MARDLVAPSGWHTSLLDLVADRGSGHTPDKEVREYWDGGIKWVSLADSSKLDSGFIDVTDKEISAMGITKSSAVLHPANTVILSRDAGVGKSAILKHEMAVSQHFIAWACERKNKLDHWFLYNWLQFHKKEFERQAVGSTIKTIGLPYFKRLKICYPPLHEQQRIAEILATWDQAIEKVEALISNAKSQKKALMQSLLTGKVRLPGFFSNRKLVKLSECCTAYSGGTPSRLHPEYFDGSIPWIKSGELNNAEIFQTEECITDDGLRNSSAKIVEAGTILVAMYGATAGVVSVSRIKAAINQAILAVVPNNTTDPLFLKFALIGAMESVNSLTQGGQPNLNAGIIGKMKLSLPTEQEQKEIATLLHAAESEITLLIKQLAALRAEKSALMQQLLTGKRRVKLSESEVAHA